MKNLELAQKIKTFSRNLAKTSLIPLVFKLAFFIAGSKNILWSEIEDEIYNCKISPKSKLYSPHHLDHVSLGDYSYIARNSRVSRADIGKFCSIGMNLVCGQGIHPLHGISTSPYFYSDLKQNGATLSKTSKVEERKWITIGNDVFIGMNVTVLDGISIGDGAVIGAGAVVSKNIPPYAIAVGCPIEIVGYRFSPETTNKLLQIKWWDKDENTLQMVEASFFDVDEFVQRMEQSS